MTPAKSDFSLAVKISLVLRLFLPHACLNCSTRRIKTGSGIWFLAGTDRGRVNRAIDVFSWSTIKLFQITNRRKDKLALKAIEDNTVGLTLA